MTEAGDANGSARNIAGVFNKEETVLSATRKNAIDSAIGGTDGRGLFDGLVRGLVTFPIWPSPRKLSLNTAFLKICEHPENSRSPAEHDGTRVFSAMYSRHCFLTKLEKMAEDAADRSTARNSGARALRVVDIGDGGAAVFKIESHNHPSFIEPCQGAATGVGGGIARCLHHGARPIANLNALRFGSPDHPRPGIWSVARLSLGSPDMAITWGIPTVAGK